MHAMLDLESMIIVHYYLHSTTPCANPWSYIDVKYPEKGVAANAGIVPFKITKDKEWEVRTVSTSPILTGQSHMRAANMDYVDFLKLF